MHTPLTARNAKSPSPPPPLPKLADLLPFKCDDEANERTRKFLSGVVKICLDYIERENDRREKVIEFYQPEEIINMFDFSIPDDPVELDKLVDDCRRTLSLQVKTGRCFFASLRVFACRMGVLVAQLPPLLLSILQNNEPNSWRVRVDARIRAEVGAHDKEGPTRARLRVKCCMRLQRALVGLGNMAACASSRRRPLIVVRCCSRRRRTRAQLQLACFLFACLDSAELQSCVRARANVSQLDSISIIIRIG